MSRQTPADPDPTGSDRPDFQPPHRDDPTGVLPAPPDQTVAMPAGPGHTTVQPSAGPAAPAPAKPRSRTVMIAVISVLAVLAVLIAGDRVANAVAQNALANALQSELSTPTRPDVSIGGFPFVTQALGGSFSSVQVTADDATVSEGETTVEIAHLDATLTDITASDRYQNVVAGRGEATALVDWAGVSDLAGQQVSYVADDRMRIDFSVPIGRLSIEGEVTGRPELNAADQTITVADPQVSVANVDVPQAVVDAVSRMVLQPFAIQGLPYDIEVTDLTVQPDGISLSGAGQDIPLRGR
ncbi:MAG TPA: DUF2993 domain-containing protein [Microlunatus sp.]|nr:DUF2993 domain-containing protein [Microlunatus sp.]